MIREKGLKNLKLRRYEKPDLDNVGALMMTHFDVADVPKRKLIFDWIACNNPAAPGEKCYLIIEDQEKIIAFEGRMPVDIMFNGNKERGYFFHDTLVHPEYRKKGMGLALVNDMKSTWEKETDTFAVGVWMNQFTHEILKRRGYFELNADYYLKPINFDSAIGKIVKIKPLTKILSGFVQGLNGVYDYFTSIRKYPGISISRILRFDSRFDELAEEISKKFSLIVIRHSRYLNWKYVDRPFAEYSIFSVERNGRLAGYIVLLPKKIGDINVGIIVDILADPEDFQIIASLCRSSVSFFKQQKADFIVCVLTNRNFSSIFRRHLFFKRRKTAPVMIANLQKHDSQETIKNISNWFLACGDSDGFVWQ